VNGKNRIVCAEIIPRRKRNVSEHPSFEEMKKEAEELRKQAKKKPQGRSKQPQPKKPPTYSEHPTFEEMEEAAAEVKAQAEEKAAEDAQPKRERKVQGIPGPGFGLRPDLEQFVKAPEVKEKSERTYVVKKGDYLSKIAKEVYGDAKRWPEIYEANKELIGDDPNLIHPGQKLLIP
jgi:nucleoid-associated protein YgaU